MAKKQDGSYEAHRQGKPSAGMKHDGSMLNRPSNDCYVGAGGKAVGIKSAPGGSKKS